MKTNSNSNATHWGCILLKAWVGSQIYKNQIYFQLHLSNLWLQFDLRIGLLFPTQRKSIVFLQGQLPCWKLLIYLQGSSCHFESMASMENTIPLGYLNMKALQWYLETLLISSVSGCPISWVFWFRDHLQWWTNSLILKEDSPLLQERSFSPFTEASLMGWGALSSHPQPLVCGIRKSQDSS